MAGERKWAGANSNLQFEVTVSNIDVELDKVKICVRRPSTDESECKSAPAIEKNLPITPKGDDEVQVWHDDNLLKTWVIKGENQLFLSYQYFDICTWGDKCGHSVNIH